MWTFQIHERRDNDSAGHGDRETPLDGLIADFDHCRFVLARGRFTSAAGFEISNDGRVATTQSSSQENLGVQPEEHEGEIVSLTWDTAR